MSVAEEPVFTVYRSRTRMIGMIVTDVVLVFFALLLLFFSASLYYSIFGLAVIGICVFLSYASIFYSSKFEFFENRFRRTYRGEIRQEVNYDDVFACKYFPFRKILRDTAITIEARVDGSYLPFVIKGNPKSKDLQIHLYDWLKQKTPSSQDQV